MRQILLLIFISFTSFSLGNAKDIDVKFDVNETLNCKFQKLLSKNSKSNFETFLPGEIDYKNIENLKVQQKKDLDLLHQVKLKDLKQAKDTA